MNFKTPDPKMAGFITVVLLLLFGFSYVVPVLNVTWVKDGATFDAALQQNLLLLLVLAVGYYIGTTKASEEKNGTIAVQAATIAASSPTASVLSNGPAPTGAPDDPVSVTVAEEDAGLSSFKEMARKLNPDAHEDQLASAWAALKAGRVDVKLP